MAMFAGAINNREKLMYIYQIYKLSIIVAAVVVVVGWIESMKVI